MPVNGVSHGRLRGRADLHSLVECRDCGLFQRMPEIREGDVAACGRCSAILRKRHNNSVSLACACAAAVLFLFALDTPLLSLHAAGRFTTSNMFGGAAALGRFGFEEVGWLVTATLCIAPALKITILLIAFAGERSPHPPQWLPWLYGWSERLNPWAMVDVFLLGVFVAYTRLRALASVEIGTGLIALGGVMLTLIAVDATIDREAIWISFDRRGVHRRAPSHAHGKLIGCHVCSRVSQAPSGSKCVRCGHALHHRKPNSLARAWAFIATAAVLYIPANTLPVMSVTRLGRGGPHTIVGGVVQLFEDHLWPLAIIVLAASVFIPIAKLGALAVMLVSTHRHSTWQLVNRTRVFRVVNIIGRWSMIDIFAVTILVALVRLGFLAAVFPGDAAIAFAGVVVLTMFATECFDPRLMWDAAQAHGPRHIPAAIHLPADAS
jgi:paraquat-inducible protein A